MNALLIGPGLGVDADKKEWILAALYTGKPCVLDADVFTCFADEPKTLFRVLHPGCVLTPHAGEFSRLLSSTIDLSTDKLTQTRKSAALSGCVILLKGADTVIANPDGVAIINTNAPPWLATGGAGDVLAGIIVGLLDKRCRRFGQPLRRHGCMELRRSSRAGG